MNKKFFAALASATMAFTASGSIAVFADDFVEESNVVEPGDLVPVPTEVVWNEANFGALVKEPKSAFVSLPGTTDLAEGKKVKTADLAEVTEINLTAATNGDVKGLEYFTKLEKFDDANATAVTNEALDFSANVKLKTLSVKKASILNGIELPKADKNEDDEDVYRLETVTLNKTKLTSVDLANYSNLDSVTVTENYNLKEVALPKGKASAKMVLATLDLSKNALETINLDHYTITNLNLNGNHIGALDLSKGTTVTTPNLGIQKLYVAEKAANVDLDKEVEGLSLFKVESTKSKKYVQDTGEFTLNTDGKENSYVYNTGLATMTVKLAFANPMNRLYNPNSGEHFYTADLEEKAALVALGWNDEGYGWVSPTVEDGKANGKPVYRLYNPNAGDHHYTMDEREARTLETYGWKAEGTGWYSAGSVTVWRQYNPFANGAGSHNYTTDRAENDYLVSLGWVGEGQAWRALK